MVEKVHGFVRTPDQFLAAGMKMFTVTLTLPDMTVLDTADGKSNKVLDALVEGISVLCQPVILGTPTATTLRFAIDRDGIDPTDAGFVTTLQANVRAKAADADVTVAIAAFAF